jgi:S-adenosylmethionine synthetase
VEIIVNRDIGPNQGDAEVEIVERKGLGHPDSICDALAEEFGRQLCLLYLDRAGAVLHHNVDKALLVAGASEPRFAGGRVTEPMQMTLAGQAALEIGGQSLGVPELAEKVVRGWFGKNLHCFDETRDVVVSSAVRPGSAELIDLFERDGQCVPTANDTSCGVGFAPLSEVERMVLAIEHRLNSEQTRAEDPALGEDVKVMAFRRDDSIRVIVACAMIDGALRDSADYQRAKERAAEISLEAARKVTALPLTIEVNVGDDVPAGRMYLTVTGTSAESGDDGQAGRGNRVNGLITPCRPMTIESVAGKNPITHVGKLYNFAAGLIADRVVRSLPEVKNAECRLVSAIGCPIDQPEIVEVRIVAAPHAGHSHLAVEVDRLVREELREVPNYSGQLLEGALGIDRWPLRA